MHIIFNVDFEQLLYMISWFKTFEMGYVMVGRTFTKIQDAHENWSKNNKYQTVQHVDKISDYLEFLLQF